MVSCEIIQEGDVLLVTLSGYFTISVYICMFLPVLVVIEPTQAFHMVTSSGVMDTEFCGQFRGT